MAEEPVYGFGQGEGVLTVVQRTPVGVEVVQGPASDERVQEALAQADVPGTEVEVVEESPAAINPLARLSDTAAPEPVARGPRARIVSEGVGPDLKQEKARTVAVEQPAKKAASVKPSARKKA